MDSLTFDIFARDIEVPPIIRAGANIKLSFVNSTGAIRIDHKQDNSTESTYALLIHDPLSVGFTTLDDSIVGDEVANFLLSMNLSLSRACVNMNGIRMGQRVINIKKSEPKGMVWKNNNRIHVFLPEVITIYDSVSFVKIITDNMKEDEVIEMFRNINKLDGLKGTTSTDKRDLTLSLSLEHYQNAMKAPNLLSVFRDLFNSLEQIVDVNGFGNTLLLLTCCYYYRCAADLKCSYGVAAVSPSLGH